MAKIYKIKVTQKMCYKIMKTDRDLMTGIPGTTANFCIHRNNHVAKNGYEPFEIWLVKTNEILPENECYNKGRYCYNEFIEIPVNSERFAIHRHKTTDNYFIKYESVPVIPVDDMTPDWIFGVKKNEATICV